VDLSIESGNWWVNHAPLSLRKITMRLDPHVVLRTMVVMALVFTGLATLVLWTGRLYPGYRRWLWVGPLNVLSFFLLNL
jgi:hypothetical protein